MFKTVECAVEANISLLLGVSNNSYLFEGFPNIVWAGIGGRTPQSLQGTVDGLTVLSLEVSLIGSFWGLRGHCSKVFQYPEQLSKHVCECECVNM